MTRPDETPQGLPEPDWHLMDPLTGGDLAAFARASHQAAADQLACDRELYDEANPAGWADVPQLLDQAPHHITAQGPAAVANWVAQRAQELSDDDTADHADDYTRQAYWDAQDAKSARAEVQRPTEPISPQELAILAPQYANAWVWHYGRGRYVALADYVTTTTDVATAITHQDPRAEVTHDDANAVLAADYWVMTARLLADTNAQAVHDAQRRHETHPTPDSLTALGKACLAADYSAALLYETTMLAKTVHEQEFLSDASPHVRTAYWTALNTQTIRQPDGPAPSSGTGNNAEQVSLDSALGVLWRDAAEITVHQSTIDYGNDGPPETDHALPTTQHARQATSIDLIAHHTGLPRYFIRDEMTSAAYAYNYAPGTDDDPDYLAPPDWHDLTNRYTQRYGQPIAHLTAQAVAAYNPENETTPHEAPDTPNPHAPSEVQRIYDYLASRQPHRDHNEVWNHARHLARLGHTPQGLTAWDTQLDASHATETHHQEQEPGTTQDPPLNTPTGPGHGEVQRMYDYLSHQSPRKPLTEVWHDADYLVHHGYTVDDLTAFADWAAQVTTAHNHEHDTTDDQTHNTITGPDPDEVRHLRDYLASREPHRDRDRLWDHAAHLIGLGYTTQTLTEWNAQLDAYLAEEATYQQDHAKTQLLYDYLAGQHPDEDDDALWDDAQRLTLLGYTTQALAELAKAQIAAIIARAEEVAPRPAGQDGDAQKVERLANELALARALLESGDLPADRETEQTWYIDYLEDELALAHKRRTAQTVETAEQQVADAVGSVEIAHAQAASDSPGLLTTAEQAPTEASARTPDPDTGASDPTVPDQAEGNAHDPGQLDDELNQARERLESGNPPTGHQALDEAAGMEVTAPRPETEPNQATNPGTASNTQQQAGEHTNPPLTANGNTSNPGASSLLSAGPGPVTGAGGDGMERARRAVGNLGAHRTDSFHAERVEPPTASGLDLGW